MSKSERPMMFSRIALTLVAMLMHTERALAEEHPQQPDEGLEAIIVSITPLMGTGVPLNHVPSNVQTLRAEDVERDRSEVLNDALDRHFASITLTDTEGNPFQADIISRGFTASPVLGTPQGIAVYQNGVRINEAFGDVLLWDFIPVFSIQRVQELSGSNAVYGLNALGGALTLEMKNGFDFKGVSAEASGGSFGRYRGIAQAGEEFGSGAFYIGAMGSHDGGWRALSPSDVVQTFADYTWRRGDFDVDASVTLAWSRLNGNGADPAEDDPRAAFAVPDLETDHLVFPQISANIGLTSGLSLHANAYLRSMQVEIQNGAASGFSACGTTVCNDSGPLTLLDGSPVSAGSDYAGILPIQTTHTLGAGSALQLSWQSRFASLENVANVGASFDQALTHFNNHTYLASLVYVSPPGTISYSDGQGLGGSRYNVELDAVNRYYGLFFTDTLSLTSDLSVTLAGRFNRAQLHLSDLYAGALNGDHGFGRFNPSLGLTYQVNPRINAYASYSEANRIPTAAELSCADPSAPCTFPLAFVSDPDLKQVVARSVELGFRGELLGGSDKSFKLDWFADAYQIKNSNDILFVSSGPLIGSGYFKNSGDTRRLGGEIALEGSWQRWDFHANYGYVRATFASHLTLLSGNNPAADANGEIEVQPGDRLPEVPLHTARLGLGISLPREIHLQLDANIVSSQYLRGDEANLQAPLPGYAVVGALASWQANSWLSLFVRADNLFDHRYSTFGLYGDPAGNGAFTQFTDPRFYVPGRPLGVWAGVNVRL